MRVYTVRFYDGARFVELNYNNALSALRMRDLLRDSPNMLHFMGLSYEVR